MADNPNIATLGELESTVPIPDAGTTGGTNPNIASADDLDAVLSAPPPASVPAHKSLPHQRWNPLSAPKASATTPSVINPKGVAPLNLKDTAADIGKTVAAQGALGATADVVGLPATLNKLWEGGAQGVQGLGARASEFLGLKPRGSADQAIALAKQQAVAKMSASDKAGDTRNIFGMELPTSQAVERGLVKAVPQLGYAPKTQAAKIIGAGARAVPLGMLTGPEGLIGKAAMGATSGALSEAAGEATEGTPYESYARLAGAMVGAPLVGKLAKSVGAITPIAQEAGATKALTRAMALDQASGSAPMTLRQAAASPGAGAWNAAGANTRALVQRLAAHPEAQDAVMRLNQLAGEQKALAATNTANHISDTLGLDQAPFDLKEAVKTGDRANINQLYETMGKSPEAQAVASPVLGRLMQSDTIKTLAKKAASVANDPDSRVVAPTKTNPGNLFYWDQIKQGLDDSYNVATRQGEAGEARRLLGLKKQLVTELDAKVPGYADARGAAAESFGAQNAIEAGYNFASKKANNFSAGENLQKLNGLNKSQRDLFAQGVGGYLKETSQGAGPDGVIKTMTDVNKAALLKAALGEDAYHSILGRASNESFMKNARALSISAGHAPDTMDQVLNAGALLETPHALGHLVLSGNPLPLGSLVASKAVQGLLDSYKNSAERAQAKTVFGLLGTTDPKKLTQLGKMVASSPKNRGFFYDAGNAIRNATVRAAIANPPSQSDTNPQPTPQAQTGDVFSQMLKKESGAQQFDKDGNVITSPKGAIGISQIMPETGPEAAKLAGEEWSPERLKTDAAYNERLGRAYHAHQTETFGDPIIGAAAYNAGPGRVRKALASAAKSGEPWVKYLPEETRQYIAGLDTERTHFARGGSVDDKLEFHVKRLMSMAKMAKKHENKGTEPLLKASDDAVVKALAVAQRAI